MSYDTYEAARLISWSNKQAGIPPLTEAELIEWIDDGVGGLEWSDVWEEDGKEVKYIDFPTLISLRLICLLNASFHSGGGPWVELDVFSETASREDERGVKWPFARKEAWDLHDSRIYHIPKVSSHTNKKKIWDDNYGIVQNKHHLYHTSNRRVDVNLEFDSDGLAYAWLPVKDVVIDARVVSGSPCVVGTRTPTWVFPGMLKGGDSIKALAEGYRLTKEQVWNALKWEKQLAALRV